jgi:hypothetical protein
MTPFTPPLADDAVQRPGNLSDASTRGVGGWLLLLCLMLTLIGPVIAVALMLLQPTPAVAMVAQGAAVALGMHAGWRLWRVHPAAVATARRALLIGLAVDVGTELLQATMAQPLIGPLLMQAQLSLLPSLVFFTLSLAYLNHSKRVQATYLQA